MAYKNLGASLRSDILGKVKRTGLSHFIFDETLQTGKNFGENITKAIRSTYEKGFDNVIIIGNDTPELNLSLLNKAVRSVNQGKLVYGRSADNGIYLLAVNVKHFNAASLAGLPWQTNGLGNALEYYLNSAEISFLRLRTLRDIDTVQDIGFLRNSSYLSTGIRRVLIAFLFVFYPFYQFTLAIELLICKLPSGTRGSPMYLSH